MLGGVTHLFQGQNKSFLEPHECQTVFMPKFRGDCNRIIIKKHVQKHSVE